MAMMEFKIRINSDMDVERVGRAFARLAAKVGEVVDFSVNLPSSHDTTVRAEVLSYIRENPGCSMKELEQSLRIRGNGVSLSIRQLRPMLRKEVAPRSGRRGRRSFQYYIAD